MFPAYYDLGLALVVGAAAMAGLFVAVAATTGAAVGSLGVAFATLALVQITMVHALDSASVPISLMLIPLCAWLVLAAFPPLGKSINRAWRCCSVLLRVCSSRPGCPTFLSLPALLASP